MYGTLCTPELFRSQPQLWTLCVIWAGVGLHDSHCLRDQANFSWRQNTLTSHDLISRSLDVQPLHDRLGA